MFKKILYKPFYTAVALLLVSNVYANSPDSQLTLVPVEQSSLPATHQSLDDVLGAISGNDGSDSTNSERTVAVNEVNHQQKAVNSTK